MKLEKHFVCPICKIKFNYYNKIYVCNNCKSEYRIINNIPVFTTGIPDSEKMSEFWDKGWKNRIENTDHQFLLEMDNV